MVLDPFAGVATTGIRAVAQGYPFRGIETHPLIAEIGALKFRYLDEHAAQELKCVSDEFVRAAATAHISSSDETDLVRRSFDTETLHSLITLREMIAAVGSRFEAYLRCALVGTLRDVASVKVGWPYQRPALERKPPHRSALKRFRERIQWLVDDLATLPSGMDASVIAGDSRGSSAWRQALCDNKARICLSSPPYLNNYDYADATRLELYFLGTVRSWAELCSKIRVDMIAASTQQSTLERAEAGWTLLASLPLTARAARRLSSRLSKQRRERPRGKEYDQMLPAYLADIFQVLMRAHENLADGATLAWVVGDSAPYGVYVDTPTLIFQMAAEAGFTPLQTLPLRPRGSRWAQNGTRHQLALSEQLILLRRPN